MIPVFWHYGGRGSWCHEIVEWLTRGCEHRTGIDGADCAIVVVKADQIPPVSLDAELAQIDRGVLIVCGNEEGTFCPEGITHPRMKVWLQTPAPNQIADRYLPWGWTPGNNADQQQRIFDWSFAGQNTHVRREQCIAELRKLPHGMLAITDGFSKGLGRNLYWELLASTRIVPCPSGPVTVDSFRVCEALECGAVPIVDGISPSGPYPEYWSRVFGEHVPFTIMLDWKGFPSTMHLWLHEWERKAAVCQEWWKAKKHEWIAQLSEDLHA